MANEDEVKIVKDNGSRLQWAKDFFYRKEGDKLTLNQKRLSAIAGACFVLTSFFLLISENDEPFSGSSIQTPKDASFQSNPVELETYNQNLNERKVIRTSKKKKIKYSSLRVISRPAVNLVPPGTMVKGVLLTGGTNGPIKAKVLDDVESYGETYFPAESILLGSGNSTDERLIIKFDKLIDPDGSTKKILAHAYDSKDTILGLKGSAVGRTSKKIIAGAGLGAAGALQTLQERKVEGGVAVPKPNVGNALLNGASMAALGIAEQELESLSEKQTIIEVPKGTKIWIVFGGQ